MVRTGNLPPRCEESPEPYYLPAVHCYRSQRLLDVGILDMLPLKGGKILLEIITP